MRYSFRVFLLNLGFIGDEYKNYRAHLLKHLSGNIAWRHPEDAIAQRERLKAEREAARNESVRAVSQDESEVGETPDENINETVSDISGSFEDEGNTITMNM